MYEFSDIDFSTAVKLAAEMWNTNNSLPLWKYLIGLCSEAVYGGRIDNAEDMHVLNSYLEQYFNDDILSMRWRPFKISTSLPTTVKYDVRREKKYNLCLNFNARVFQEYIKIINQLSIRDQPFYFGLAENIDRAWEKNTSSEILSDIKGMLSY